MASKLSEDQLKEVKEAFYMFDPSGTGKVKTSDLGTAVRSLGQNPSESKVTQMIKEADKKGSGFIQEKDFIDVITRHWAPVNTEEDIVDAFKVFDREGTGYLVAKDLKNVLLNLGERLSEEEVEDMLQVANLDADGQLNYTTLTQILLESARR